MSSFCNKTVRARRSNAFRLLADARLYSQSPFLGMNENARLGAIKRGSPGHRRLRSPLSLRSLHSSLRNHFGPSLGCQTRENWEVGVGALGGKAWTTRRTGTPPPLRRQLITRTISCPPSNQPSNPTRHSSIRPASPCRVPASSHDVSRPGHLTRSCAPSARPSACV